jgi:hypothetical protein
MAFESLSPQITDIPLWLILIAMWDIVWRAFAVIKSTRKNQPIWSVMFVLFQTAGILPILYICLFAEMKTSKRKSLIKLEKIKPISEKRKVKSKSRKR